MRVRVIEIGEAVKNLEASLLALEPGVPWSDIVRMRDLLAHHYFDTNHAVVRHVVEDELDTLEETVRRLMAIARWGDSSAGEFA